MPLHPQARALMDGILASGGKPIFQSTPEEARAMMAGVGAMIGPGPEVAEVLDITVQGGPRDVPARVYTPAGQAPGVVVYFHGGGCVMGALDDFDAVCRAIAVASGWQVVSVDYALAPEHPYPAAVEDAGAALAHVSSQLAGDRPVVVMGDSSGGLLATVTARRARDAGGPPIALQVLVYPPTDTVFEGGSYEAFGTGEYLNGTADMHWFYDHYIPDAARRGEPDVAPLRVEDLSGLPPAVVVVADHDALLDEGRAYAARLAEAGVPVEVIEAEGQMHGFFTMVNVLETADEIVARVSARIAAVAA